MLTCHQTNIEWQQADLEEEIYPDVSIMIRKK